MPHNKWATVDPWYMLFPGLAVLSPWLAFNLFGDGPSWTRSTLDRVSSTSGPPHGAVRLM